MKAGEHTEYGVRYDAPEPYAGLVADFKDKRAAERRAATENELPTFRCVVVQRVVTVGEWIPAAGLGGVTP